MYHAAQKGAAVGEELPITNSSSSSSSSSSTVETEQHQATSTLLLLVLVCRSLLVLHEALLQLPEMSGLRLDAQMHDAAAVTAVGEDRMQEFVEEKQHEFAAKVLHVFANVRRALHSCFLVQQAATGAAEAERATGHMAAQYAGSSSSSGFSSSSSSSSSREPVRWQHLLRLQESRKLMNALHTLDKVWNADAAATTSAAAAGSSEQPGLAQQRLQQFHAALRFCRVLVSVAPLPVVRNNPGCVQLGGASEAAAARFMCAGCGCRYCSAACQAAGWRGHKKACRRMADCGMRV
jgi:hypothetical protein